MQHNRYYLPAFLIGVLEEKQFSKWLDRKAKSLLKRDRARGNPNAKYREYKMEIYRAVVKSQGKCAYTGKMLRWDLVCAYDNEMAKLGGRRYRRMLSELPTVDHLGDGLGVPEFRICSWVVNSCKGQLELAEFLRLCADILTFHDYRVNQK